MRLTMRDVVGAVLFLAAAIFYWGFLLDGDYLFVKDERGMAALGLALGVVAFLTQRVGDPFDTTGKVEWTVAGASLALGVVALLLAESASAAMWLAVFMASLAVVWLMELADHVGWVPHEGTGSAAHG